MNVNQFDFMGGAYGASLERFPNVRRNELVEVLRRADPRPGETVLDFAAGTGFLTIEILKKVGPQGRVIAVDISEVQLKQLRATVEKRAFSNLEITRTSDPTLAAIPTESVDKVVSLGGYHHVENQVEVTRALFRVLKPGGKAVIFDFKDDSATQRHFDTLVHEHNGVGHRGLFFTRSKWVNICRYIDCGEYVIEEPRLAWAFKKGSEIGEFFKQHHGLDASADAVQRSLAANFGLQTNTDSPADVLFDYSVVTLSKTNGQAT